ncbi:MAG: LysM peptidoglycan-binding domain-containing protein [Thermoleophilaceae bacterium]|nr:LysM peptidoglycan-binding domain-containing protein [Thermoleophilaceae bacterium]
MYRRFLAAAAAVVVSVAVPATASAQVAHVVQEGETLWSIAADHGLTTGALAVANGLSEDRHVLAGETIRIPAAEQAGGAPSGAVTPSPMGAYTVRQGDTLSAIAARNGSRADQIAWMNGLDPDEPLLAGTALKLPTGAPDATDAPTPASGAAEAAPHPTQETVAPALVEQVALEHGVPSSLATAIAEQESGFNNALVSSANARGVMQLLPGTWDFVQSDLAGYALQPASAQDNVHAGVLYLGQLLRDTGGDEAAATAAYYQGLSSIRNVGLLPETRAYVASVMALRQKYGG